jgi:hypothetical protein
MPRENRHVSFGSRLPCERLFFQRAWNRTYTAFADLDIRVVDVEDAADARAQVVRHMRKQRSDVGVYMIQQRVVSKSKALLATYRNCAASAGRPEFGGGRVPSSGLVAVYALKNLCKSLTAYGFGSHRDANYQYYKLHGTQRR